MQSVPRTTRPERNTCRRMTVPALSPITGFVLIGGRSRRLGLDKASLRIADVPAADRMARVVGQVCRAEVFLVGRDEAPWSSYGVLPDGQSDKGPLAGVATALEHCRTDLALIVATDLWQMSAESLQRIATAVRQSDGDIGVGTTAEPSIDVAHATTGSGRDQPLCAVWRVRTCLPIVRQHLESGDLSMFGVLDALRTRAVIVDDVELMNVNEPSDLERYLRAGGEER